MPIATNTTVTIISEFPPPDGGIGVQALGLKKQLKMRGYSLKEINTRKSFSGIFFILNSLRGVRGVVRYSRFLFLLCIKNNTHLYHVFSSSGLNFYLYTLSTCIIGKITKRPVIVNYHGGAAKNFFKKHRMLRPVLQWKNVRLVVPSEYLYKVFSEFGIGADIIPNVIDIARFDRIKKKDKKNNEILLSCRNHESIYRIDWIIKAAHEIISMGYDISVIILGQGSQTSKITTLIKELNISDHVKILGNIENKNIPKIMRSATMLVNASCVDNMPVSLIEAQAAELLVVSSDAGGIPYLIKDGINGYLFSHNNYKQLVDVLKRVYQNENNTVIIKNARSQVQKYEATFVVNQWEGLYREFLS